MSRSDSVPTLEDVARAAGVSTATVSRCLNKPDKVVATTRERVLAAVEQLGYTPHFGARIMAARQTFTIGAIIPTMENAIFAQGLQAFQEAVHARGYTLLVSSSAYQPEREAEQIRTLLSRGADGLLLIGYDRDPETYKMLAQKRTPVLATWAYDATQAIPAVGFDNHAAMFALAQHVLSLGHAHIGVISGMTRGNDRAAERLTAIRLAAAGAGLGAEALPVIETPYSIENGAEAFAELMRRTLRPSVVLCGNDVLAAGAVRQAAAMGLRVPEDVSITGFDDIELARVVTPALTTVHVPHRAMGAKAAEVLINMVEGGTNAPSIALETTLKLRASLGPPKLP
ncbi:LacI family DNA-binding transcriptional regulator [Primorskyibacter sp. S187A]|uniref:LacI family DNA-binding transcriptional regulator n=1 Tax=Primorskyibacter sp. S187A TaxID=3415130 RepID=UPI003C7BB218